MMKRYLLKLTALLALLFASGVLEAQTPAKLYTKKARMADFPSAVTKVVLGDGSMLELAVRQEIIASWNSSPYEFCAPGEYETLKSDNSFYFLQFVHTDGIVFMVLSKGGKEDETDQMKVPFEVVRMPVGAYGQINGIDANLIGAFVDIIQQFALKSMESDRVGYTGMDVFNRTDVSGKTIVTRPDKVSRALEARTADMLVGVFVAPLDINFKSYCYKMLIDAGTHEMYYYSRVKYKDKSDAWFSDKELARFEKHNAVIDR